MKSSLTDIIVKALYGKKIAKQQGVHENYWGKIITKIYPARKINKNFDLCSVVVTDAEGEHYFTIDADFQLEVE